MYSIRRSALTVATTLALFSVAGCGSLEADAPADTPSPQGPSDLKAVKTVGRGYIDHTVKDYAVQKFCDGDNLVYLIMPETDRVEENPTIAVIADAKECVNP